MSEACINPETNLLFNPENENACKCSCKAHWLDGTESYTYGKYEQYTTCVKCSQCGHHVAINKIGNMSVIREIEIIPDD